MCTVLLEPETLPAKKRSISDTQKAVDQLMEYDSRLSEPFSREDLRKLFGTDSFRSTVPDSWRTREMSADYRLLTSREKQIVDELGSTPRLPEAPEIPPVRREDERIRAEERRRFLKAGLIEMPCFDGSWRMVSFSLQGKTGKICVWLDNMNYCSEEKGFYYVRYQNSMLWNGSTAYALPVLVVQKSKLRPDQVEYMERKCEETRADAKRKIDRQTR